MNRGSYGLPRDTTLGNRRFNEAPIHESGKLLAEARRRPRSHRFNEAPIHESGKYQPSTVDSEHPCLLQ